MAHVSSLTDSPQRVNWEAMQPSTTVHHPFRGSVLPGVGLRSAPSMHGLIFERDRPDARIFAMMACSNLRRPRSASILEKDPDLANAVMNFDATHDNSIECRSLLMLVSMTPTPMSADSHE